jgi:integrase
VSSVTRVPIPSPRDVTVTDAERDLLLNAAPMYLRCWILLCADLALRSGTAARVAPEHYNAERREVSIGTKEGRVIVLPVSEEIERLFLAVGNREPQTPYVSQLHRRQKIHVNYLRQCWWRLRKSVGIERGIRPHDLRRTLAVKVYDETRDLRDAQAVLGHKQLATTVHYLDHRNTPVPRGLIDHFAAGGRNR